MVRKPYPDHAPAMDLMFKASCPNDPEHILDLFWVLEDPPTAPPAGVACQVCGSIVIAWRGASHAG